MHTYLSLGQLFGLIAVILMSSKRVRAQNECAEAINIGSPLRSTNCTNSGNQLCDSDIDENVWYRFDTTAGVKIPEGCVFPNRCSTSIPITVTTPGSHPPEGDPNFKMIRVSAHTGMSCTDWTEDILVQWCAGSPSYYIYKLKRPPGCPMSYCAGNQGPCTNGQP